MKRFTAISATAVAAALFLAGCGSDTGSNTTEESTGMDHSIMSHSPAPAASDAGGTHNSADAMFAQMMIPHHEQAAQMSDIMLAKDDLDPQITRLAENIKAAQAPEIEKMTGWLQTWDEQMEMSGDHVMEGMLSSDDLAELEASLGAEASRLFLTQMIEHHEGAIAMAEEEAANGQDPDAVALAETIVADQKAEIEKMNNLLAAI
ncbi:DUF305 domain-containing protein [Arthrobacter crystallopoietes]|uniref:DUF305 domain-containing protein n=1 Tax=Crystallibacter crystallopoietes TaxID=37928 RepID=UPI001ABE638D|nr:DUF305 domain-containing protein [Arthrobacter crystallopoietes]QTG82743.1 DUF305 domain-containing protein [Arthrobacter crystallopoietes]